MNVFWREQPLNEDESELYQLVLDAHHKSAFRGNISGQAVVMAAAGSQDYYKAIAGGLLTLGDAHGPIRKTVEFLACPDVIGQTRGLLNVGAKVPGWGNSFVKGLPDEIWLKVDFYLRDHFPAMHIKLRQITEVFRVEGKMIYPNPSAYTAAAAIVLGLPAPIAAYLLVMGRVAAWTQMAADNLKE